MKHKILQNFIRLSILASLILFIINSMNTGVQKTYGYLSPPRKINFIDELIKSERQISEFKEISLFNFSEKNNKDISASFAKSSVTLEMAREELSRLLNSHEKNILLRIPVSADDFLDLELTRVSVTTNDFKVRSLSRNSIVKTEEGLHYRGVVRGEEESFASISIFKNFVSGIIATAHGNLVLGPVRGESGKYILYNDADLLVKNNFKCGVNDYDSRFILKKNLSNKIKTRSRGDMTTDPIRIYFVADYQMYLDNGSSINQVANFILSMFNHVGAIYQNESIPVVISQIDVYDFADPYVNYTQSDAILLAFGANTQDNFNGDLAQLISTRNEQMGGIAWINVLCQSYDPNENSGRFSFTDIDNDFLPYPLYSWTVMVVTHELGHNLASKHTHACVWPVLPGGGIGAIDSCYPAEGTCFTTTQPKNNGTIMSYCHLNGNINFLYGFGPLPGDTIREGYHLAVCLDSALNSSETPLVFSLSQNYPNPFNPSTTIRFSIPDDGYATLRIFNVTGRELAVLINNRYYPTGIYSYSLNSALYAMSSGVYFYKLDVFASMGEQIYSESKKMVLLK